MFGILSDSKNFERSHRRGNLISWDLQESIQDVVLLNIFISGLKSTYVYKTVERGLCFHMIKDLKDTTRVIFYYLQLTNLLENNNSH